MKNTTLLKLIFIGTVLTFSLLGKTQTIEEGVEIRKIWGNEYYNAFTSLIFFNNYFYCSFRQGSDHVGGEDGVVRIIRSKNRIDWESVAVLEKDGYDLRDPKLSVAPDGRLMVIIGGSVYKDKELKSRLSHVSFSNQKGEKFSHPQPVYVDDRLKTNMDWLCRVS